MENILSKFRLHWEALKGEGKTIKAASKNSLKANKPAKSKKRTQKYQGLTKADVKAFEQTIAQRESKERKPVKKDSGHVL